MGKIKLPIKAPKKPPKIDKNADEFFPPYIFIVNADSKNSNNSKKTQTNNAIIKIFLDIISKLVNKGNFEQKIGIVAQKLSKEINDSKLHSGKSPQGLAGAFVYISSVMNGYHIPQREIAEYAEVTEVTIRNRCREILQHYSIKQKLKTIN